MNKKIYFSRQRIICCC